MTNNKLLINNSRNIVCIIVGTRPGIIKMSPLIRECEHRGLEHFVLHTGQHYSPEMDNVFFRDLGLKLPKHHLKHIREYVTHGAKTGMMLMGIEKLLMEERPRVVLVCGDANTNLAGALAARKLHCIIGHVESGLRSNDWRMPEEHNRVIMDHISELLFAPTEETAQNLRKDNVRGKIIVTGNTIVDAVMQNIKIARSKSTILLDLGLKNNSYFLMTIHREENVDNPYILADLIECIKLVIRFFKKEIIFPLHPRTGKRLKEFGLTERLDSIKGLRIIEPLGYLDMLVLLEQCAVVLTDSGGLQEEACILEVPCVTLRENTERPETVLVGANVIAGTNPRTVKAAVEKMLSVARTWTNPLGDGRAAERIIDEVQKVLKDDVSGLPC
ncbi:UDP-N-acetylglucosamine 2-epimerase [Dissulfuribacter thermophilus]|uniref:UDP-N-acetylglucosamine 2-epimerase n=1 Tax=Dissulfuribacter thermophilus TaxID=1156395 RepID=A0A1B9F411_9BACT|nr:UDP-N-acetylglucosamine 2-epimerase (non-hydrolyzing) [Dissulfuribacter thermophilus]OCC14662.1 UDP-N-acetylglucosamine 2-epimerase [Dissulfuribacter thermophilus]